MQHYLLMASIWTHHLCCSSQILCLLYISQSRILFHHKSWFYLLSQLASAISTQHVTEHLCFNETTQLPLKVCLLSMILFWQYIFLWILIIGFSLSLVPCKWFSEIVVSATCEAIPPPLKLRHVMLLSSLTLNLT